MGRDTLIITKLKQPKVTRKYFKDGSFTFLFDGLNIFKYIQKRLDKQVK